MRQSSKGQILILLGDPLDKLKAGSLGLLEQT